jgi:hypothetical protein
MKRASSNTDFNTCISRVHNSTISGLLFNGPVWILFEVEA